MAPRTRSCSRSARTGDGTMATPVKGTQTESIRMSDCDAAGTAPAPPSAGRAGTRLPPPGFPLALPEAYDKANIIQENDYNVWGTNILKGHDGTYHAIYSRWPRTRGHLAWATHSEIAHAVSDSLIGPYVFRNRVLPARGRAYWDGDCTHNPHVLEHDGRAYLYHMGNRGSGYWDETPATRTPLTQDDEWWVNRNNQRIGLAIADDLNGPWQRSDKPLIDIDPTRRMVSTPTVSMRPDGRFLMAYKTVEEEEGQWGGRVIHVTALADSPTGPFVDTGVPFITHPTSRFAVDDHVEWFQDGRCYCIAKDCRGAWTDDPDGSMLWFHSDAEGLHWSLGQDPLVIRAGEINWTDGSKARCRRTADMPKLYVEDGIVKALIIAVLPKDSDDSFAVVVRAGCL